MTGQPLNGGGLASAQVFDEIQDQVTADLAGRVQLKTNTMLARLLPDDAPQELVAAVIAGMFAGLVTEIWERSTVEDLAQRKEALAEMVANLARDYADQFIAAGA